MPPTRISRGSMSAAKPKAAKKKTKAGKRSLNAFAIAGAEEPETHRIRRSRLGEVEDNGPRPKRRRDSEDEDDEEEREVRKKPKAANESDSDGSDGEGNTWKVGVVDSDDDSDIDSEEAFGSSDEEKFQGWSFGAGKAKGGFKTKKRAVEGDGDANMDLEEEEVEEEDDDDLESLGSDAVDLATMLDNYVASEDEEDEAAEDGDTEDSDNETPSDFEASDSDAGDRAARLQSLVSKLHPAEKAIRKPREADAHESRVPSASGLVSAEKFDIKDFLATTSDPQLKKVSKEIGNLAKIPKKDLKLAPSLPKRQKDRLDRVAANEKAKQTLERWVDTVKHQRRADHLMFPLADPETNKPGGTRHLPSINSSKPFNELESAIQNILQESGLTSGRRDEEEEKLLEFEELKANKMPIEEVQARRAELRKARDLMFREEVRAKRIKKIKSKAYRRIHRKEREKLAALERDAFTEGGEAEMDDEERETADRRRAEERMGLKHKDSKWAKQMKKSGRTTWDDDAVSGVTEMAKKHEELRRRIEGKDVRDEDASDNLSSSEDDDEEGSDDDEVEFQRLQKQLGRVADYGEDDGNVKGVHGMKFMRDAEARRKAQNKIDIEKMRRELAGEDSQSGDEAETIGRRLFAPSKKDDEIIPGPVVRGDFEEAAGSDEEDVQITLDNGATTTSSQAPVVSEPASLSKTVSTIKAFAPKSILKKTTSTPVTAPTDTTQSRPSKEAKLSTKPKATPSIPLLDGEKHSAPDADGWVSVSYDHPEDEEPEEAEPNLLSQTEILRRAFAGDDVEEAFEAEKKATIADEDDKVVSNDLPGWGTWTGLSLSKREKAQNATNKKRFVTKIAGIRPEMRKDRKLNGVIVNQKRVKGNSAYLASELPFPFKSKAEYERSIRMPIGGEWNVESVRQENVKPRVIVKPGAIVKPMARPLV